MVADRSSSSDRAEELAIAEDLLNLQELAFEIAGVRFQHPALLAAGMLKTLADGIRIARNSASASTTLGSYTILPRPGNIGVTYHPDPPNPVAPASWNALGLPGPGFKAACEFFPAVVSESHTMGKPVIVSIAGETPDETAFMADEALTAGCDFAECNFGCPNGWDEIVLPDGTTKSVQRPIVSHDRASMRDHLDEAAARIRHHGDAARLGVKLSPLYPTDVFPTAQLLSGYSCVKYIATCNTIPNTIPYENGRPVISVTFAGQAGPMLKPIALGQVRMFHAALTDLASDIKLIGVGGVSTAQDVADFLQEGAIATMSATAYWTRRERVFEDILNGLLKLEEEDKLRPG